MAAISQLYIEFRASTDQLHADLANVTAAIRDIDKEIRPVTRILDDFGQAATKMGTVLTAAFTLPIAAIAAMGISFNALQERSEIAFTTLLGSAEKAHTFLTQMKDFAAATPFEFPDLIKASQRMLAYGFTAKEILPTLTAIGDAAAFLGGSQESIARITLALGQIKAKGTLQAEEMRQLGEAGIPAWQILADKLGISIPKAMDMTEKRLISGTTAVNALIAGMNERFGGGMAKIATTWTGLMSTVRDDLRFIAGELTEGLFNALKGPLTLFVHMLESIRKSMDEWSNGTKAVIAALGVFLALLGPALLVFGQLAFAIESIIKLGSHLYTFFTEKGGAAALAWVGNMTKALLGLGTAQTLASTTRAVSPAAFTGFAEAAAAAGFTGFNAIAAEQRARAGMAALYGVTATNAFTGFSGIGAGLGAGSAAAFTGFNAIPPFAETGTAAAFTGFSGIAAETTAAATGVGALATSLSVLAGVIATLGIGAIALEIAGLHNDLVGIISDVLDLGRAISDFAVGFFWEIAKKEVHDVVERIKEEFTGLDAWLKDKTGVSFFEIAKREIHNSAQAIREEIQGVGKLLDEASQPGIGARRNAEIQENLKKKYTGFGYGNTFEELSKMSPAELAQRAAETQADFLKSAGGAPNFQDVRDPQGRLVGVRNLGKMLNEVAPEMDNAKEVLDSIFGVKDEGKDKKSDFEKQVETFTKSIGKEKNEQLALAEAIKRARAAHVSEADIFEALGPKLHQVAEAYKNYGDAILPSLAADVKKEEAHLSMQRVLKMEDDEINKQIDALQDQTVAGNAAAAATEAWANSNLFNAEAMRKQNTQVEFLTTTSEKLIKLLHDNPSILKPPELPYLIGAAAPPYIPPPGPPTRDGKPLPDEWRDWAAAGQNAIDSITNDIAKMFLESIVHGKSFWQAFKNLGLNAIASITAFFIKSFLHAILDPLKEQIGDIIKEITGQLFKPVTDWVKDQLKALLAELLKHIGGLRSLLGYVGAGAVIGGAVGGKKGAVTGALAGASLKAFETGNWEIGIALAAAATVSATWGKTFGRIGAGRRAANKFNENIVDPFFQTFDPKHPERQPGSIIAALDANSALMAAGKQTVEGTRQLKENINSMWQDFIVQSAQYAKQGANQAKVVGQAFKTLTPIVEHFLASVEAQEAELKKNPLDPMFDNFRALLKPADALNKELEDFVGVFDTKDIVAVYADQILDAAEAQRKHGYAVEGLVAELEDAAKATGNLKDAIAKPLRIPKPMATPEFLARIGDLTNQAIGLTGTAKNTLLDTIAALARSVRLPLVIPQAAEGGFMAQSGMIYAHAGEVIGPFDKIFGAGHGIVIEPKIHVEVHGDDLTNPSVFDRKIMRPLDNMIMTGIRGYRARWTRQFRRDRGDVSH